MDFGENEKIGYEKGKIKKRKKMGMGQEKLKKIKKIICEVIYGVHISLFGGEVSFYPPPYATSKNLTNHSLRI